MTRCMRLSLIGIALLLTGAMVQGAHPTQTGTPRAVVASDYSKKLVALVNADNSVAWQLPIKDVHDLHLLPDGHVLLQTNFQNVVEVDGTGKAVWTYDAKPAANERVEIHAFQRLSDGATMIAESGRGRIIEVDREGRIRKTVPLQLKSPDPHRDTRLVRKLDSGNYLVAHEAEQAVKEYDPSGKVVWEYSVGSRLYSVSRLASGNTLIGTGDGHRVIEVSPAKQIVWSVEETELPGIKLGWITMVERLPNGNTFIVNCHAGPEHPQLIEVNAGKNVVWTFKDFERFGNSLPVARVLDGKAAP